MDIGSFVRKMRRDSGLSQSQLADKAGVGLNFVYQMEKNKPTVQLDCARQVLNALGFEISVSKLVQDVRPGASFEETKRHDLPWD
jgi:y4mF family transcriptional regulator